MKDHLHYPVKMNIQAQVIISIAVCYLIVMPVLKALRDIIAFRFSWSIFDNLPKWLKDYLTDSNPNPPYKELDGWHQTDAGLACAPLALLWYWGTRLWFHWPWWLVIILFVITTLLFYAVFNLLFHFLFMKKEYWGK